MKCFFCLTFDKDNPEIYQLWTRKYLLQHLPCQVHLTVLRFGMGFWIGCKFPPYLLIRVWVKLIIIRQIPGHLITLDGLIHKQVILPLLRNKHRLLYQLFTSMVELIVIGRVIILITLLRLSIILAQRVISPFLQGLPLLVLLTYQVLIGLLLILPLDQIDVLDFRMEGLRLHRLFTKAE